MVPMLSSLALALYIIKLFAFQKAWMEILEEADAISVQHNRVKDRLMDEVVNTCIKKISSRTGHDFLVHREKSPHSGPEDVGTLPKGELPSFSVSRSEGDPRGRGRL